MPQPVYRVILTQQDLDLLRVALQQIADRYGPICTPPEYARIEKMLAWFETLSPLPTSKD